jgi:hypothetical protein
MREGSRGCQPSRERDHALRSTTPGWSIPLRAQAMYTAAASAMSVAAHRIIEAASRTIVVRPDYSPPTT